MKIVRILVNILKLKLQRMDFADFLSLVNRQSINTRTEVTCWMKMNFYRHMEFEQFQDFIKIIHIQFMLNGNEYRVDYEPAESSTGFLVEIQTGVVPSGFH